MSKARSITQGQAAALAVVALMIIVPAAWVAWSLSSAAALAETVRSQSVLLEGLRQRIADLDIPAGGAAATDKTSIYLPGETAAIAGAALQQLVASAIAESGGRVVETEFAPTEATEAEDPGRVDLRVSFDTEIVGLQRILFTLERGPPVLFVRTLQVQSPAAGEITAEVSPPLRAVMLVGGYWEAQS